MLGMYNMYVQLVTFFVSLSIVKPAKILVVVPIPSISHQVVFRPLVEELVNRDHEVTVITTDPAYPQEKTPNNLREINVHDSSYILWNKMLSGLAQNSRSDMLTVMTIMYCGASKVFEEQLKDDTVQKLIGDKSVKFDLMILEACIAPLLIFTHIFKAPVILMSAYGANVGFMEMIGAETHPLIYPSQFHERTLNLTIWEAIREMYNHVAMNEIVKKQENHDDNMLQSIFGVNTPSLSELKDNVDMLFLNIHPIWGHNQPVPPNVFHTWGIRKKPKQTLSKDFQSYLDSSKNGVIYISFGTNFKSSAMPSDKVKMLVKVFSQLPYDVLWKWDLDELPGKSENIKISKWVPQCEVLNHPNLKLFITQGGLQSTDEAINGGVPLIGIPIFTDQEYNTEKYVDFEIGIKLNFKYLTADKLENAINTILSDERYRKNIIHLREQVHDQPRPALENAIWWVEYVLRHGGARHLRTPTANMSCTEYYELELLFVILIGLIVIMTLLLVSIYYCFKCMSRIIRLNSEINKINVS